MLYPIPNFEALNTPVTEARIGDVPKSAEVLFLSINRYERKKNLKLALEAFGKMVFKLCLLFYDVESGFALKYYRHQHN